MKPADPERYSLFDKFGIAVAVVFAAFIVFGSIISAIQYSRRAGRDFETRNTQRIKELEAERATNPAIQFRASTNR